MVVEKQRKISTNGDHKVTFTVTIAMAFLTDSESDPKPNNKGLGGFKGRRRVYEAPKPQNYYHLEYKLLPDDADVIKTDVVTYGVAAKIYTESDSKVMKTWRDGDKTWVAWTHSHTTTVTKDMLLRLFGHTLALKVWDTKDRVSPRARFDRPKAFRLPMSRGADDESDDVAVQQLVMKQSMSYNQMQPKPSIVKPVDLEDRRLSKTAPGLLKSRGGNQLDSQDNRATTAPSTFRSASLSVVPTPTTAGQQSLVKVQVRVDEQQRLQFSRIADLAGVSPPMSEERARAAEATSRQSRLNEVDGATRKRIKRTDSVAAERQKEQGMGPVARSKKSVANKQSKEAVAAAQLTRVNGVASLEIKMSNLFADIKGITNKTEKSEGKIEDLLLTVSLDDHLLSTVQKRMLNPMVIKVCSVSSMPCTPLSYRQLREKCKPVTIGYKFFKQPRHDSLGREHGREVYWQDRNVVLLGNMDKDSLAEYLQGPPLEIEVHDRDRKIVKQKVKPSLFGEFPEDELINNVSLVAGKRTTHNPFEGREKPWDPYGIAKFDLSGLLLGQKVLNLRSPVHPCPLPDTNTGHENPDGPVVGRVGNVDGPEVIPMPAANYLEAGSELKIKVDLAFPLNATTEDQVAEEETRKQTVSECPFGRIMYIFEYSNGKFLRMLQSEITSINAAALDLDSLPTHVVEAALSTYKLSNKQKKSKVLDIITGFQVLDGQFHVFVLEGIAENGIRKLWNNLPRPKEEDLVKFNVLYNSEMSFQSRLYSALDVDLCRVRLHEPLMVIVQNPLLYVRDLVTKPCFEALSRLDKMVKVKTLREVSRNDLFPTADMVTAMSREFGVPLTAEDFGELESDVDEGIDPVTGERKEPEAPRPLTSRPWTPLELNNLEYVKRLKERQRAFTAPRDFIKENILRTRTSEPRRRPRTIAADASELHLETAHNYSIQTLNSTEHAREKLRHMLAQEEDVRFTYCPQYNSATVLPVEPEAVKKEELLASTRRWRTTSGFIFPGSKTSLESNVHAKKPGSARMDELHKPWKENVLHSNILKPTVDRIEFSWESRRMDFNILSRPAPFFDNSPLTSVHSAGDTKEGEQKQVQRREKNVWSSKIVVDDTVQRSHRCLAETELKTHGPKSSNQLAKLEGLLKDEPKKYSLRERGLVLEKIPALSVVVNPSVDTNAREAGISLPHAKDPLEEKNCGFNPGAYKNEGWLLEKNKIPIRDPKHTVFERLKGHDFRLYFKDNNMVCRRPIEPLKPIEKDAHLFAAADLCS